MTLNEKIKNLEFQLTLKHQRPESVGIIQEALDLLKEAQNHWREPGEPGMAISKEKEAAEVLRRGWNKLTQ